MMKKTISALLLCLLASAPAHSGMTKFSSGTGFFVSRAGDIITSAHVLKQCQSTYVQGNFERPVPVELINKDDEVDLALLRADIDPPSVAYLRLETTPAEVGDKVMLLGYPEEYAGTGKYDTSISQITALKGPQGEEKWIQFENAARHGNSGGPLLDSAGNVIGVITAKSEMIRHNDLNNTDEVVSTSDVAVGLPALQEFMMQNRVYSRLRDSTMLLTDSSNAHRSSDFIVNVLCMQGAVE
jgi:serine protease Do